MKKKPNTRVVKRGYPKRVEYMWRWKEDSLGWMISYPTYSEAKESAISMERPKKAKTLQIAKMEIASVTEEKI